MRNIRMITENNGDIVYINIDEILHFYEFIKSYGEDEGLTYLRITFIRGSIIELNIDIRKFYKQITE